MAHVFDTIRGGIRKTRRFIANLAFYGSTLPSALIRSSLPSSRPIDKELTPLTRQQAVSDAREIQTNSAFATGMVDTHIQYMGTYKFKCKSPYPEFNARFELLFNDWKRRKNCEVAEAFCFDELLQIIERHRIADQAKSTWTQSQKIKEDLDRATEAQKKGIVGADEAVKLLQSKFDAAAQNEALGSLGETIARANEAAMTLADKEKKLAEERDAQTKRLAELQEQGRITQADLDNATALLAKETQAKVDALHESKWDKSLKDMFELRVPIDQRLSEAFAGIKEAGDRLKATPEEMENLFKIEKERIEKMYGMEEKRQKDKETASKKGSGFDGGSFAVAGSVEAYRISATSSQDKTTKAVEKVKDAIEDGNRELIAKINDKFNFRQV